jgi:chromosome segregation ATPase
LLRPLLRSAIAPAHWSEECARCAPRLTLRISLTRLHWRQRLVTARHLGRGLTACQAEIEPRLSRVRRRAEALAEVLRPLDGEWRQAEERLSDASQRLSDASEHLCRQRGRVDELAAQLGSMTRASERALEAVRQKAAGLVEGEPLAKIRDAVRTLHKETRELSVRIAHAQSECERV